MSDQELSPGKFILICLLGLSLLSIGAAIQSTKFQQRARPATGYGGYLDHAENQRRNMSQTGVDDRQIPLIVRKRYAREHGIKSPTR